MSDFQRLIQYLRPHLIIFIVALVAMVLTALFQVATGAILVPLLDQFNPTPGAKPWTPFSLQEWIPQEPWYQSWFMISVLLLTFTICKGIFSYVSAYLMAKIGQSVVLELRRELYSHLLTQSTAFFENHRTNFLVSRLVVSCAAIEQAISGNLRDVIRESFILVGFMIAALSFSWRLTLGFLIIGPIIALLTTRFSKSLRNLAKVSIDGNKDLSDAAQETISNQTIVKAYNAESREKTRFSKVAEVIATANLRSGRIAALSPVIIETIGIIAIVILLYFGLREINLGNLVAAQFFTFLYFLLGSYDPMRKISRQHNEISQAFAAAKDVWDVLDEQNHLPENPDAIELTNLVDKISLEDVSFNYQIDNNPALTNVSLEISNGQMIALVGESGGGKSSLIKLIQRLYDPTEGRILWDGIDLRDAKVTSLRKQIALVTQETVLFNDTVRYNISYGNPEASDEEVKNAAKVAFADEFIEQLPEKYETRVGERGMNLSGGQRQRLAIARAVLINAPVIILDEATSALDTESETLVQKALSNLMKNHTSIVIAHRLSTIRMADKIIVLEQGKIIETGTHEELIGNSGKYKILYELQFEHSSDL